MKFTLFDLKSILNSNIKNKSFLFYKINNLYYDELEKIILKNGGIIKTILTNKIDYVITSINYDSNIEKLIKKKITILQLCP